MTNSNKNTNCWIFKPVICKISQVFKMKYSRNCLLTVICLTAIAKHWAQPSHPHGLTRSLGVEGGFDLN